VREVLKDEEDRILCDIADDLHIAHPPIVEEKNLLQEITFWRESHFRLFLSHVSSFKAKTAALQKALFAYGIHAFVAHEDIEPTKEWQTEIEKALFSMDALAAILTSDFHGSRWTDQEVGTAIGRNVLVIPVRKGIDPYGLMGKYQGLQGEGKTIGQVAQEIYQIIRNNAKTSDKLLRSIVEQLLFSQNEKEANNYLALLGGCKRLPIDQVKKLQENAMNNETISSNPNLVNRIKQVLSVYSLELKSGTDAAEDTADEIPF